MSDQHVALFRPAPNIGLGPTWHVVDQRPSFMIVAPLPCGFVQATIQCEQATIRLATIISEPLAKLERKICRHCITAVRAKAAA